MSCNLHNAGHPWQGSGEKMEMKTLRKESGSNKGKKEEKDEVEEREKRGKRGQKLEGEHSFCYSKLTLDRLVISNTGICEAVAPCCVVALYTQLP